MPSHARGEPIPAIGYIRVSTAREEMISPELQEAAIRDWARRNGRRLVEIIPDLDKTGRNFKRRVQEAIAAVRDGQAREIIVWKFSRFGRNRHGWATHLELVEEVGGQLISATEEVDARTAAGRFTRGMLAEVAAFESDRASEQWKEAHAYRITAGLPPTGGPRWGYIRRGRVAVVGEKRLYRNDPDDPDGERYEPHPDLRNVLVSMYVRYVAGEGSSVLAAWLNAHGYRTVRGGEWSKQTLLKVLDSGFAAGLLRVHNADCGCKQPGRCANVSYPKGAQEAIIDPELWEAYRARRNQLRTLPPRSRVPIYPLSGLLRCGACGRGMTAMGRGHAYRCNSYKIKVSCDGAYTRRDYAENAVLEELAGWAKEIEAEADQADPRDIDEVPDARPDVEKIGAAIARIERALVRLKKLRAMDEDDDEQAEREYLAARDELRAERASLEEMLAEAAPPRPPEPGDYGATISELVDGWTLLTPAERRNMLAEVVRVIRVHRTGFRTAPRIEVIPVWAPEGA